jgi:hypothetical protein
LAPKFTWSDLCLTLLGVLSGIALVAWVIVKFVMAFNSNLDTNTAFNNGT